VFDGMPPYEAWRSGEPEPTPQPRARAILYQQQEALPKRGVQPKLQQFFAGERPAIEQLSDWSQVAAALPQHPKDGPDWSAALEQGVIKPVSSLTPGHPGIDDLPLNVSVKGSVSVTFSHTPHTKWLACENCHTAIFPMEAGKTEMTMADLGKGKHCGACHGSVAFDLTRCARCHTPIQELELDVQLAGAMNVKFPHAPHAAWLPCDRCHDTLFPMAAGKTRMDMADLAKGKYCGTCHGTGKMAFDLSQCERCHVKQPETDLDVTLKGPLPVTFPHAPHTRWLPCDRCHDKLFPMAAGQTTMDMADLAKGKYCGACHGVDKVGFDLSKCERCHAKLEGTDLNVKLQGALPVTFPHAPHTRWLPCDTCHDKLFPMAAGQTKLTMGDLAKGKYCGVCHAPGKAAFDLTRCERCHAKLPETDLDVKLQGPLAVTFPHAPHTRWLPCESCHDKIFPMVAGRTKITMGEIAKGKYCGVCHGPGKAAFDTSQCARCHVKLPETDLNVTLQGLLPVTFPHAPHTRWLPCDTCHDKLFPMAAGQTKLSMGDLAKGKYCGACHGPGKAAFDLTKCERCHTKLPETDLNVTLQGLLPVTFPHAPHTRWVPCESCHDQLFPMSAGQTKLTMADLAAGKYCGVCHGTGKAAFDLTQCARCHAKLEGTDLDVPLQGPPPVTFRHAPHTRWVPCEGCHEQLFPMAAGQTKMTMADLAAGKYCGVCHGTGKAAFDLTQCGRCHTKLEETDLDVILQGPLPVTFRHAPHTRWVPCDSCHDKLFPMAAGATAITMDDISKGLYCGACHGTLAFPSSECGRCHLEMAQ